MILLVVVCAACLTTLAGGAQTSGEAKALRITSVSVPELVELETEEADEATSAPVLDCVYELTDASGLVLKWFHESSAEPVYQWIPPQPPQALGILHDHVDLNYTVSKSKYEMHRALRLVDVKAAMSGRYTCVVSTFDDEDRRSAIMQLYTRGKNLDLTYEQHGGGQVEVLCTVEDVFPQPTLNITWGESSDNETVVAKVVAGADGLYDAVARAVLVLPDGMDLVCQLYVPYIEHEEMRTLAYQSGVAPTVAGISGILTSIILLLLLG